MALHGVHGVHIYIGPILTHVNCCICQSFLKSKFYYV